ncbi:MAG: hypothetical protein ACKO6B_11065 [Planctomycetia bacterium]
MTLVLGSADQGRTWRGLSAVGLPDLMDACEPQGVLLPDNMFTCRESPPWNEPPFKVLRRRFARAARVS